MHRHEIEAGIKSLPTKMDTGPDGVTAEFYQNLKAPTLILIKWFSKIQKEEGLQNSFLEASIT